MKNWLYDQRHGIQINSQQMQIYNINEKQLIFNTDNHKFMYIELSNKALSSK